MGTIKTFAFSLVSAGSDIIGAVSANMGGPFRITEIQFVSTVISADTRRLRIFVSPDREPANVAAPNGTNILASGGGTNYFVPDLEPIRLSLGFVVPDYNRSIKVHFDNTVAGAATVSGSITVELL